MSKKQHKLRVLKSNDLFENNTLVVCSEKSVILSGTYAACEDKVKMMNDQIKEKGGDKYWKITGINI